MLDKNKLYELLNKREFLEILEYFEEEYKQLIFNFLINKGINFNPDDDIRDLMSHVEDNFPQYYGLMQIIKSSINNEDITIDESLDNVISNYNIIKQNLT